MALINNRTNALNPNKLADKTASTIKTDPDNPMFSCTFNRQILLPAKHIKK